MGRRDLAISNTLSKEESYKACWEALEAILKSLKTMKGNPACKDLLDNMWEQLDYKSKSIRYLENELSIGGIFQIEDYNDKKLIVRLDGYAFSSGDFLQARLSVIACTDTRWDYNTLTDHLDMPVPSFGANVKKEFTPEDLETELPLWMGFTFKTDMYANMIQGKNIPEPETEKTDGEQS